MKRLTLLINLFFLVSLFLNEAIGQEVQTDSLQNPPVSTEPQSVTEEISVVSFKRLENDITARVTAPKRDQNNDVAAIVKVVTRDKGLFFEPDALGIVARVDQPGEIWLYLPHGAKRITIKHELFGVIRNYFYNESIDKATVYEMVLYVPERKDGVRVVERVVERQITSQVLMMNYSPNHAKIYIDDVLQESTNNGAFLSDLSIGKHRYRLESPYYFPKEGELEMSTEKMNVQNITLEPDFGFIYASATTDKVDLFVDNEPVGQAPYYTDTIRTGKYELRAERRYYKPQVQAVDLKALNTESIEFKMKRQKPNTFVMPQVGISLTHNVTSYGAMLAMARRYGGYISFRTNGKSFVDTSYDRYDDYSSGDFIYSGETNKSQSTISAGFMLRVMKPLYVYVGGGILSYQYAWGLSNEYQQYSYSADYTGIEKIEGAMAELGVIGRYKMISLSAGVAASTSFDYVEATVGIGFVLGKWY